MIEKLGFDYTIVISPTMASNRELMDRINVVAEYDSYIYSPSIKVKIPSVVVLKEYVRPVKSNAFTRFNLF